MQEELYFATKRRNNPDEAEKLLKAYAAQYGQDYRAFNDLGAITLLKGRLDEAMDYLNTANRLSPNNPAVLNNMGLVYAKRREYAQAAQAFKLRMRPGLHPRRPSTSASSMKRPHNTLPPQKPSAMRATSRLLSTTPASPASS
jgi:Flp pilus assembly protein TadD